MYKSNISSTNKLCVSDTEEMQVCFGWMTEDDAKHKLHVDTVQQTPVEVGSLDFYQLFVKIDGWYEAVNASVKPDVHLPFQGVTSQGLSLSQSSA